MFFMQRQRMKDLLLRARVVIRTPCMKISRCHLADYVQKLHQKACRTCSTIIFLYLTDQVIDLCCCRSCSRRRLLNSLFTVSRAFQSQAGSYTQLQSKFVMYSVFNLTHKATLNHFLCIISSYIMLPALKNLLNQNISVLDIAHLIWKTSNYGVSLS